MHACPPTSCQAGVCLDSRQQAWGLVQCSRWGIMVPWLRSACSRIRGALPCLRASALPSGVWVLLVFHISAHVSSCPLLREVPSCPPCPQWTLPLSLVTMHCTYPFPNICHDLKSCCYVSGCMFVVCFHPLDVCSVRTGLGLVSRCPQRLELCLAQRRSSVST